MAVAAVTAVVWYLIDGTFEAALVPAVAVLIIACPAPSTPRRRPR